MPSHSPCWRRIFPSFCCSVREQRQAGLRHLRVLTPCNVEISGPLTDRVQQGRMIIRAEQIIVMETSRLAAARDMQWQRSVMSEMARKVIHHGYIHGTT
ncbi:hypothetical protein IEO21_07805 [Rhodonia placenta]|uniref:Uncharacterized protein n=1 Tax=Rhodonia placenta TaxID=104341 RepID=A0A8H7NXF0_9APHY|nr:hypothetical protein IEO21_07805 [Postia placenta]